MRFVSFFLALIVVGAAVFADPVRAATPLPFAVDAVDRVVSTDYPLAAEYTPADLVAAADYGIATAKPKTVDEMKLRLAQDAHSADTLANLPSRLARLLAACEAETGERAKLGSGYRSFEKQRIVYARHRADGQAAVPGASEHQAGLAVDIAVGASFITARSKTYGCLTTHAWAYGFILSYPDGNTYLAGRAIFEPWHWRYVGLEAARLIHTFGRDDYPAEFLARLSYFRWLDVERLAEDWAGLTRAVTRLVAFEQRGDESARAYASRVDFLSQRVTRTMPTIGARLALEYLRWRAERAITPDVAGLRTAYAEVATLRASDDRREKIAAKKVERFADLLRADVLGTR